MNFLTKTFLVAFVFFDLGVNVKSNQLALIKSVYLHQSKKNGFDFRQPPSPEDNRSTSKLHHSVTSGNNSRKYLWVRMAVIAKVLDKMADFLVQNHK